MTGSDTPGAVVLLTGFAPFDGETINPSFEIARRLDGATIAEHRVIAAKLPCEFGAAIVALREALDAHRPRLVLALGQADGRCDLSIERIAINMDDARIPDNAGRQPVDEAIVAGAPAAYFSTLPIKAMVAGLRAKGIPSSVSQSAGTYVCNHVFFGLMHELAQGRQALRGGFMHVPLLPEQAARRPEQPCLPLEIMVEGVRTALEVALRVRVDLRETGGRTA